MPGTRSHGIGATARSPAGTDHVVSVRPQGGIEAHAAATPGVSLERHTMTFEPSSRGSFLSYDLCEIELAIRKAVQKAVRTKTTICIALARIKSRELYRQAGCSSFKEYLREQRIGLPYHTAYEYAKIGEIMHAYRDELQAVRFEEEAGLKKLLLLDHALRRNGNDRESVFAKLNESSYREFREYAYTGQSARADCPSAPSPGESLSGIQLDGTGECIVVKSLDREIIWFDTDMEQYLQTAGLARSFKLHILEAVKDFFVQNRPAGRAPTSEHRD